MMQIRFFYTIFFAVFAAGCMFAVTSNEPRSSLSASPVPVALEPVMAEEPKPLLSLNEEFFKQVAVVGAVVLLMAMILKSSKLPK